MRSIRQFVAVTMVMLSAVICSTSLLTACPFCTPSLTYSEQLKNSHVAALVRWKGDSSQNQQDLSQPVETRYEIISLLNDESKSFQPGQIIKQEMMVEAEKDQLFLLIANQVEGEEELQWDYPLDMNDKTFDYILKSPARETPVQERLLYFIDYLENEEPLIAMDAYSEIAMSSYDDVSAIAERVPKDSLRKWLSDPQITPTRIGLYGMLLGLIGSSEDADFLMEMIQKEPEDENDVRIGIDGVIGGYLLLTKSVGLERISQRFFESPSVPMSETYSAIQAVQFMWTYGGERIPKDDLRASMRVLLNRPELAEIVIVNLARWQDWSAMDQLMERYGKGDYALPTVKRTIVRYLLAAEGDYEASSGSGERPPYVINATRHLQHIKETDPQSIESANRYLFD